MIRIGTLLAAALVLVPSARGHEKAKEGKKETPPALEKKFHGDWKGTAACQGDLTLRADGTFERTHYSPGNNTVSGTWEVKWDALPPTLVLTCTKSDQPDQSFAGKAWEGKVTQLDDAALVYELTGAKPGHGVVRFAREKK